MCKNMSASRLWRIRWSIPLRSTPKAVCTNATATWWITAACVSAISPKRTAERPTRWTTLKSTGWRSSTLPSNSEVVKSCSRFRRRNGNGKNPDGQGVKSGDFFAPFAKKYYSSLDRLDSRNGYRTGIVFNGEICYTWVSKLTSVTRRIELNERSNVFNTK